MFLVESITWEISLIGLSLTMFTLMSMLTKPDTHKTDILLCVWLVVLNIPFVHTLMAHLDSHFFAFKMLTNPTLNLLHGPILYLYVRMLVSEKSIIKRSECLHFIPFAIIYLMFITMSHPKPMTPLPSQPEAHMGPVAVNGITAFFEPLLSHFGLINGLFFVGYSMVTIFVLVKHQKKIVDLFSQNDNQVSLKWVYALPAIFAIVVVVNVINEQLLVSSAQISAHTLHMMSFICIVILLCFFGVKQKPVFSVKQPKTQVNNEVDAHNLAAETNEVSISDEQVISIMQQMNAYMRREKPYLEPDFSVDSLADALSIPRRTLSFVLSKGLSKNFYQYVNEFRIEAVKNLLSSQDEGQSTILDIAFQSGFKSKSSFNSLFKQYCDVTPSQFRKMLKP